MKPYPCDGCLKSGHLCYGCMDIEKWENENLYDSEGNQILGLKEAIELSRKIVADNKTNTGDETKI